MSYPVPLRPEKGEGSFPTRVEPRQQSKLILTTLGPGEHGTLTRLAGIGISSAEPGRPPKGKRILIVSADSNLRSLMRSFLEHAGFNVASCADVSRGTRAFRTVPEPELLLVDLHLLGRPGFDLALSLSADRPGLLVVALYGADTDAEVAASARRQRWMLLIKPFLVTDLLTTICSALDSGREYVPTDAAAKRNSSLGKAGPPCGTSSEDQPSRYPQGFSPAPDLRNGTQAGR
jgi:DNA-binding NarL/FixJ family response regulator